MNNKMKLYILGSLITVVIAIGIVILLQPKNSQSNTGDSSSKELIPVDNITHAHGLAVGIADTSNLYIATHHGLLLLKNEKYLFRIGNSEDDYMGFTPHPTNQDVFFSSGHPSFGGNLGVLKSEDGGFSWQKIADGINGPVDFHAMTVSSVNPDTLYGWYGGALQRSGDGGTNWEIATRNLPNVISLAADTQDEDTVYAATAQGLMYSDNRGNDWETISPDLKDTAVAVLAINPQDSQKMLSFSEKLGLAKSTDGGIMWEKVDESFTGEIILHIAFSKQNPKTMYTLTQNNALYKSTDDGTTWNKIHLE